MQHLSELPMAELEACVEACMGDNMSFSSRIFANPHTRPENSWVTFEAAVRSAAATALGRLRAQSHERCAEVLRLCEFEEQTRCQAFQAAMMGEVSPAVYQAAVKSILDKLLGKLETFAPEPSLYQAAAQCLSEYMSALNHHCDICAVPLAPALLPAIAEGPEGRDGAIGLDPEQLYGLDSSDYPSELGSEDAETLSVHSETISDHGCRLSAVSGVPQPPRLSAGDGDSIGANRSFGTCMHTLPPSAGIVAMGAVAGACMGAAMGGAMAHADPEALRKERRREANKKASVKYRTKKASSMQHVLADFNAAQRQIGALSSQNAVLTAENGLLKQQVEFLQNMLQSGGRAGTSAPPSREAGEHTGSGMAAGGYTGAAATTDAPMHGATAVPLPALPPIAAPLIASLPRHWGATGSGAPPDPTDLLVGDAHLHLG